MATQHSIPITLTETAGVRYRRPVTGGVPIARGLAPEGSVFFLTAQGKRVPLQSMVLNRWQDGSARWVLLDFLADPDPGATSVYRLGWHTRGKALLPTNTVDTADLLTLTDSRTLRLADRLEVQCVQTDERGECCAARMDEVQWEVDGPMRATLAIRGAFTAADGRHLGAFRLRVSVYAGTSAIRLEPMILADTEHGLLHRFKELALIVRPIGGWRRWRLEEAAGWQTDQEARLFQVDDQQYTSPNGGGTQAPGWVEWEDAGGHAALALRDYWQQWPKAFDVYPDAIALSLFPRFTPGTFDHMSPDHKYGYLFEGDCYRLRVGQARHWEAWIDLKTDGPTLAQAINAPLVPVTSPKAAVAAGVWGEISPAGPATKAYDAWVNALFAAYQRSIEQQRDYGAMNWGDWYGERFVNWGNHEYDTPYQLLMQYARTGDLRFFYAGDTAARHMADVDVVHAVNDELSAYFRLTAPWSNMPSRPGLVHEHCVGHVGGFHTIEEVQEIYRTSGLCEQDQGYLCLEPFNLGHVWTEGLTRHYFLTGNPWIRETVERIADHLALLTEEDNYHWMGEAHCGRVTGWTLLALAAAYELDWSPRYLRAMAYLVDKALADQDPHCGGWLYDLPPGHCDCKTKRHVGKAGFILSILVNGLSRYGELTGDPRIPDAVRRAITHLNNDTWKDERGDWRYTSCPSSMMIQQIGVTMLALVNSVRLSHDPEHLRILTKAWNAKCRRIVLGERDGQSDGKTFTHTIYGSAETVSILQRLKQTRVKR